MFPGAPRSHSSARLVAALVLAVAPLTGCGGSKEEPGAEEGVTVVDGGADSAGEADAADDTTLDGDADATPADASDARADVDPDAPDAPDGADARDAADAHASDAGDAADAADEDAGPSDASDAGDATDAPFDAGPAPFGATCAVDGDCASKVCRAIWGGATSYCVTDCLAQLDCSALGDAFCDPIAPGDTHGYCVPRSPAHCLDCSTSADCGGLSEACFVGTGDSLLACHVDCSLAGDAACPADYACVPETVGGVPSSFCEPRGGVACSAALGGFCDRVSTVQPCTRAADPGSCGGTRTCDATTSRYRACDAAQPACRPDCATPNPPQCSLAYCAGVIDTPANCGSCGTACPGVGAPDANVTCVAGTDCGFSCQGESYDVDGLPDTGCEVTDPAPGHHTQATAADAGTASICGTSDSDIGLSGHLPSDARVHENPDVEGFDAATGSAPDWFTVVGADPSGSGVCSPDLALTLTISGATTPTCYALEIVTDAQTSGCDVGSGGTCSVDQTGAFTAGTAVLVAVRKTCSTSVVGSAAYTVTGHL